MGTEHILLALLREDNGAAAGVLKSSGVTYEQVLYGGRQRIWDQAENRRHAQKALVELLIDA